MTQSTSSTRFDHRWRPRHAYLLDPSLYPTVATVVKTLGWNILTVADHFAGGDYSKAVPDEQIIRECKRRGFAWITANEASQKDHCERIWRNKVHVLWIHRPGGVMSPDYQFTALTNGIAAFDCRLDNPPPDGLWCEMRDPLHDHLHVLRRVFHGSTWRIGV